MPPIASSAAASIASVDAQSRIVMVVGKGDGDLVDRSRIGVRRAVDRPIGAGDGKAITLRPNSRSPFRPFALQVLSNDVDGQ